MAGITERVVVTGMGVASPLGCTVEKFWEGLLAGKSGVGSLEGGIFSGLHTRIGGVVWGYEESQYFDSKEAKRMSRSSQLGIVATSQAISEAALEDGQVNGLEVGVMIGSSIGGYSAADPYFKYFYIHDPQNFTNKTNRCCIIFENLFTHSSFIHVLMQIIKHELYLS